MNDGWRVLETAGELSRKGVEFALATVVWRQAPSSGHQGARAIITADGEIHGWIGGACAEPVVVREAKAVIESRQPRLILLGAPDRPVPEGMMVVPMSCQSEGAMELYIEPVIPSPHVVVVGRSPMASTLVDLARTLGWQADLVDATGFVGEGLDPRAVVVIATQGHGDEEAMEQALHGDPAYIGLVASRKRAEAVLGYLADRGVSPERLNRVKAPVGVDLGHTTHTEIAVSVLAELVAARARGELYPTNATQEATVTTAIDPVCGMTVAADETSRPYEYEGTTYYFCAPGCRVAFEKDPTSFIGASA
jgi:xanthine dehydrogenase accessory factor